MKKKPDNAPPVSPEQGTRAEPSSPANLSAEPMRIRVSIVEDDSELRQMLGNWLETTPGFVCASAHASGTAAVAELPAVKPEVVLMDINLPGLRGIECVDRLKPLMPNTHFLMLTVYGDTNSIFQALEAGAVGYLLKRTSREELFAALRLVQAGGSPISSGIARRVAQVFQKPPAAAAPAPAGDESLSERERQVLDLLSHGHPEKQIADRLGISPHTVHTYVRRIYEKLHVHSHAQAVAKYNEQSPV
jgi:DNA-binding NarL/FixJ family response regulator